MADRFITQMHDEKKLKASHDMSHDINFLPYEQR